MKLRNKKTGEVTRDEDWDFVGLVLKVNHTDDSIEMDDRIEYRSLAELNEEWEDYSPAEPLIKDEKVRKAVRAWAEANDYSLVKIGFDMASEPNDGYVQIHFEVSDIVDEDKYGVHTIAELCGEEEE